MVAHALIQTEDLSVSVPRILLASTVPEVCYSFPSTAPHALSSHSTSTPLPIVPHSPAPPLPSSHKMVAHASIQMEFLSVSIPRILLVSTVEGVCYTFPSPSPHALSFRSSSTPVPLIPDSPAPHLLLPHTDWWLLPRYKWKIYLSVSAGFSWLRLFKEYVITYY